MKPSSKPRPARSVVLGDGYVGMNCIPRRDGAIPASIISASKWRMWRRRSRDQAVRSDVERGGATADPPFAAYSAHDPDTNIFDLSAPSMDKKDVYAENNWTPEAAISRIALRTRHAERCAQFYVEVFGLKALNRRMRTTI